MSVPLNVLTWPDYLLITVYIALNLGVGWWVQRRSKGTGAEYFLGSGRVPTWASAVSFYGTAVSSVSFMALPAYAYAKNWLPMLVGPMAGLAGFVVGFGFVGIIRGLRTPTVYAYLESRFSREVRLLVAGLGAVLKVFGRSSVIMVLPALALSAATGMNVYLSIALMGFVTTLYSTEGGFAAVVWTDVIQVAVMMAGVALVIGYAAAGVDGGLGGIIRAGAEADKFQFVSWEWSLSDVTGWVITGFFIGHVFTIIADQPLMQRVLAAKDDAAGRRAIFSGSLMVVPSNAIFFFVGTALFAFYQANPDRLRPGLPDDAIVGFFIANELPAGVIGLIIAAIFAAAMSTLSSSLSGVAAIAANDFLSVLRPRSSEASGVKLGKWVTLAGGVFATGMAMWVASTEAKSIWEQSVELIALFGGSIPGVFALGMLTQRANSRGVMIGAAASITVTVWVQNFTTINSFLHAFMAFATSVTVGYLASLWPRQPIDSAKIKGLTVWDLADGKDASTSS